MKTKRKLTIRHYELIRLIVSRAFNEIHYGLSAAAEREKRQELFLELEGFGRRMDFEKLLTLQADAFIWEIQSIFKLKQDFQSECIWQ